MVQIHGGNIYNEKTELDFSANINPLGMPECAVKAFIGSVSDTERYPDPYCRDLVKAISENECFPEENITAGNGADDLIFRICMAFRPKKSVIVAPSFSEYEKALKEAGSEIVYYEAKPENDFDIMTDIADMITDKTDMIFIASPNNPTGRLISADVMRALAEKCLQNDCILVADECFIDFVYDSKKHSIRNVMNKNVIILKAFTKIYAMPGIRLGYVLCGCRDIAEKIRNSGQFWSVSSPAQATGTAALKDMEYVRKTAELIECEREYLSEELRKLGFYVFDTAVNFILFRSELPLYKMLMSEGILIRDCSNYRGLSEGYFRIAVRSHGENEKLVKALERCKNGQTNNDTGHDVKCRKELSCSGTLQST